MRRCPLCFAAAAASGRNHVFASTIHIQTETGDRPLFPALLPYLFLLVLALLVVFHVLPYGPVFLVTAAVLFVTDRKIFRGVDYFLLLTFLCFFIFVGNVRRLPEVNALLTSLVAGRELWTGLLASQIISNVPAAVLLSDSAGTTRRSSPASIWAVWGHWWLLWPASSPSSSIPRSIPTRKRPS